jgi:hypothetical protein
LAVEEDDPMSKRAPPTRWTYEEFARLPEGDGNRYKIIAGELYVSPAPGLRHQRILTKYRSPAGSAGPAIHRDRLVWRAAQDAPPLELDLAALFQT